jgi:hypothetical protein
MQHQIIFFHFQKKFLKEKVISVLVNYDQIL